MVGAGGLEGRGDSYGCEEVWVLVGDGKVVDMERKQTICGEPVNRTGKVERQTVNDIVLDTGHTWTMVRQDILPADHKVTGQTVQLRSAHGDITTYPLADIQLQISGVELSVTAVVSKNLPVSVLLGTDVPQLGRLLHATPNHQEGDQALVVTRAQARKAAVAEEESHRKQVESQVQPNPVMGEDELEADQATHPPFSELDNELFDSQPPKKTLT